MILFSGARMALAQVSKLTGLISGSQNAHTWQFSRVGGVNRVNFSAGDDIASLGELDPKLWAALSCPVTGLELDEASLKLMDADGDGRIRVKELVAVASKLAGLLKEPGILLEGKSRVPIDALNTTSGDGETLAKSAKRMLALLGKENATDIGLEETAQLTSIFAGTPFNGDGVITEDSATEEPVKRTIAAIVNAYGGVADRGGKQGVNSALIARFFDDAAAYIAWNNRKPAETSTPYEANLETAASAFEAVRAKIDDFFLRCRLAEYDPASVASLNANLSAVADLSAKNLALQLDALAALPLATISAGASLPLTGGVHPAWTGALETFRALVVNPLFKQKTSLTAGEWASVSAHFSAFLSWKSEKPQHPAAAFAVSELEKLATPEIQTALLHLVAEDEKLASEADGMLAVDRFVRLFRDLPVLLRNFVNFADFYEPGVRAIFEAGELYLDERRFDLCIRVSDFGRHKSMAGSSGICLVYCECTNRAKGESMTIVAALTDGDNDDISVGRNALFYDRKGQEWDATIIHMIDNPISIRQAFWSPYKKLAKFISTQIENLAASKEKEAEESQTAKVKDSIGKADAQLSSGAKPAAAPAPFDIAKFAGIFATLSLALSAIGSVLLAAATGFLSLKWWQMPLAAVGLLLSVSLPSMLLAYLKLRKRNLAPLLNANGWAINARLTINILFGQTLTHLAQLPPNAKLNLIDPFSKKKNPWIPFLWISALVVTVAMAALWYFGYLEQWGLISPATAASPVPAATG
jgi:hypothetical protein